MRELRDNAKRKESGFTLVEVILAISILSVMVVLNYRLIKNLIETKIVVDDKREGMFIANSVLNRLTRELQLAVTNPKLMPPCDTPTAPRPNAVLIAEDGSRGQGKGPTITFAAREAGQYIPDSGSRSGVVQISYRVEQDPDQKGNSDTPGLLLVREEVPNKNPVDISCKKAIRFPITNQLVNLEYKFFDRRTKEWYPVWTGPQAAALPGIIQFSITLKSPKGSLDTYTTAVALN
jgi:prepilin-type N-terminal cleavage/methylation domain-containing protein